MNCFQGAGDGMDSMLDEGSARLLLDSTPSKVISNEMTVSFFSHLLHFVCLFIYF